MIADDFNFNYVLFMMIFHLESSLSRLIDTIRYRRLIEITNCLIKIKN